MSRKHKTELSPERGDILPVDFFEVDPQQGHPDSNRTAAAKAESIRRRTVRRFNRENRGKY